MRFPLIPSFAIAFLLLFANVVPAFSGDEACAVLWRKDPALISALPPRLQAIMTRMGAQKYELESVEGWNEFQAFLDRAARGEYGVYNSRLGALSMIVRVSLPEPGVVKISFPYIGLHDVILGDPAPGGRDFLRLVTAVVEWMAKNRHALGIRELRLVGNDLRNTRLIDLLNGLGFRKKNYLRPCLGTPIIGAFGGYTVGTMVRLVTGDLSETESGSLNIAEWMSAGGALTGFTFFCVLGKTNFDYGLGIRVVEETIP